MRLFNICKKLKNLKGNKAAMEKVLPFKEGIEKADKEGPTIAFISKMNHVKVKNINEMNIKHEFHAHNSTESRLIGFGRLFSGTLKRGDKIMI